MTEQTEREALEALFEKLHDGKSAQWLDYYGEPELSAKGRRFNALMGLNAYLDAALMLVPEGFSVLLAGTGTRWLCDVHEKPLGTTGRWYGTCEGNTPALALCAAIEAAIARAGE